MSAIATTKQFLRSRSGRGFLLHLALCAGVSAAVGYGFYYSSLNWFKEHKSEEKIIALRLVDAFVTNYSALRAQFGADAPVPATFRAHSIDAFNKQRGSDEDFSLRWVGREGRQIATPPSDAKMAKTIDDPSSARPIRSRRPSSSTVDDQLKFRTIYPSLAREQSCVDCHNKLQPNKAQWRLNDVMGAFAIDVPIGPFLHTVSLQSTGLGHWPVSGAGSCRLRGIQRQHFRQMIEREVAHAELGRTRTFLDTIIENMPAILSVKDAAGPALCPGQPRGDATVRHAARTHDRQARARAIYGTEQAEFFDARDREAIAGRRRADRSRACRDMPRTTARGR